MTPSAAPSGPALEPMELRHYTGLQRAAALMLALGEEHGAEIWAQLGADEVRDLSVTMAQLGRVPARVVEYLLLLFAHEVSTISSLHGSFETTERLLKAVMPGEQVSDIMNDIRGPAGRTMWDKLSNVNEAILASYLKHEYPQTVAVVLTRLRAEHAARVMAALPRGFALDVIRRMLKMEDVQKSVVDEIEQTLKTEFMANLARTQRRDPHELMAEMFNALDRATEESLLGALDKEAPGSAERIRSLMFTFSDLAKLLPASVATLVKNADKRQLSLALKGAPEEQRQIFLASMTERAAKLLREDIASMGPVRARECEEAQTGLVRLAKLLADRGEIMLIDPKNDDSLIF